jgi:DNA-binding transcriptional ArsR family regulator
MPTGGQMGRRRKSKLSRFVALHWEIIDSRAWQDLSNASRVALIHLKRKVFKANPGEISLSYNEMEKIMCRHAFAKALKQLEDVGFITKEQQGGLFRRRNFFRLSENWRRYGKDSSA